MLRARRWNRGEKSGERKDFEESEAHRNEESRGDKGKDTGSGANQFWR